MAKQVLAAIVLALAIGNALLAQQAATSPKVGDLVCISLKGDVAKEYARRTEAFPDGKIPDGLETQIIARVERQTDDGACRISHIAEVNSACGPARLVTLSTTVARGRITTHVIPKGTSVSANPGATITRSESESKTLRLELADLEGLKLRTWTLTDEAGK